MRRVHLLWRKRREWRGSSPIGMSVTLLCRSKASAEERDRYTLDSNKVTCKLCLRSMKQYRVLAKKLEGK